MAGSIVATATPLEVEVTPRRTWVRRLAVVVVFGMAGILAAPAAVHAQIPPTPEVPELPPQVTDALNQAEGTLIPVLVQGAIAAQPVANAGGFALRPGCAGIGTAVLLVVLTGGSLPVSPGFVSTPVLLFCAGAFAPGPADPVFDTVDGAAGAQAEGLVDPVLGQVHDALAPARPQIASACAVIALSGSTPTQVPPPLNRFDITRVVC
jgi:hypothetical protein